MQKLFSILKSRIEPFIGIVVVIVVVVLQLTDVKDEMMVKIDEVSDEVALTKAEVQSNKEAWRADDAADEVLYMTKLDAIQNLGEEMQQKQMVLEANLDGLKVITTMGADERQAQLEGRLIVLQRQMMNMSISQQAYIDTLGSIQRELDLIQSLTMVRDTVIVVETDTLMMKKEGRWYWWDPD